MSQATLFATPATVDDWPADYEAQFWMAYPRRCSKIAAMKSLAKVKKMGIAWAVLMTGVARYAAYCDLRGAPLFVKHPTTWLNQGCWDDELPDPTAPTGRPRANGPSLAQIGFGGALRRTQH